MHFFHILLLELLINIESVLYVGTWIYERLLTGQTQQCMQLFTLCSLYLRI